MSLQAKLIKAVTRRTIKRHGLNQQQLVRHLRKAFNHIPVITLLPRGVRRTQINDTGFEGDRVSTANPEMTILYLHGGGYVAGVTRTYFNLAGRLAKQLNAEVYLARYPFAPEHPYPAAVNRSMEAYQYLLKQGRSPDNIAISGDSAGGGLTLATLLHIRDRHLPQPRCAVTLSPGCNATPDNDAMDALDASDAMLSADMIRTVVDTYIPNQSDRHHPYASPLRGDYRGIAPLMILVSNEEVLYADVKQLRQVITSAGGSVTWLERDGVFHVWPIMVPFLPEANQDLKRIVRFIRDAA